jgi:hypothetical protein
MVKSQLFVLVTGVLMGFAACDRDVPAQNTIFAKSANSTAQRPKESIGKMQIKIGSKTFTATLAETTAAAGLKAQLPLTLKMSELNGNEKHGSLSAPLPKKEEIPGTIQKGDLMLWQDDTLVIFYKTFRTTYSYTRLGWIDDPTGFDVAVGSADVTVTFEPENRVRP